MILIQNAQINLDVLPKTSPHSWKLQHRPCGNCHYVTSVDCKTFPVNDGPCFNNLKIPCQQRFLTATRKILVAVRPLALLAGNTLNGRSYKRTEFQQELASENAAWKRQLFASLFQFCWKPILMNSTKKISSLTVKRFEKLPVWKTPDTLEIYQPFLFPSRRLIPCTNQTQTHPQIFKSNQSRMPSEAKVFVPGCSYAGRTGLDWVYGRFPFARSFSRHNFPAFYENWVALIHEQGHSGQNQFWELVCSIYELTGRTGQTRQIENDQSCCIRMLITNRIRILAGL